MKNKKVLIVGAGFAGATIARKLAENDIQVHIIDKRNHIGGNAFDYINNNNERLHKYGPHLLHGIKDSKAIKFLSKFTDWIKYEHKVRALLKDGTTTPLPVNMNTLEDVYKLRLKDEFSAKNFINKIRFHDLSPKNTDEVFLSNFGEKLSNIFFRPYTKKMWGIDPKNLAIGVGSRLPVRINRDDRYFSDSFQALPDKGYKSLFENLLSHQKITIELNKKFNKTMENDYFHIFLCLPIDSYFDYCFGNLPYRSIIFEERKINEKNLSAPVINFTDNLKYTRKSQWSLLPNCPKVKGDYHTVTYEIPVDIKDNPGEYYYPIHTFESNKIFLKYLNLSKQYSKITFCGRKGLFRYIDMIPCVTMHLEIANKFLNKIKDQKN